MILGIDARRLVGQRTGVARYLSALLREWSACPQPFERMILYSPSALPEEVVAGPSFERRVLPARGPTLVWENVKLAPAAREVDVLFCPSNTVPLLYRGRCVVTIHDAIQELWAHTFPWWYRLRYGLHYRWSAHRADAVLTGSESSRTDLLALYKLSPGKVATVPLAAEPTFRRLEDRGACSGMRDRLGLGDAPLVLFVGKLTGRRNVGALIAAFATLRADHRLPHRLVIVGPRSSAVEPGRLAREHGVSDAVVYAEYVSDDDLALLYNAADLFVLPSSYEGFGLPNLEAMQSGVPVITGNNSSLKEVAGDGACLLDDLGPESLSRAMAKVLLDRELHDRLAERGLQRARGFSWARTAERTMQVLAEVAGRG